MQIDLFQPDGGKSFKLAATATSSASTAGQLDQNQPSIRIYNAGPNQAYIRLGGGASAPTANASTDMCIPAGDIEVFGKEGATFIAAVCDSGNTATLYITPGEGS